MGDLTINATGLEPSTLEVNTLHNMKSVIYPLQDTIPLFDQPNLPTTSEPWGDNHTVFRNDAGEYLNIGDGDVRYYMREDPSYHMVEIMDYFLYRTGDTVYKYPYVNTLEQELTFVTRQEAADIAVNTVRALHSDDFLLDVTAENVYAATYEQITAYHKILRATEHNSFKATPGSGQYDFGGDGLYRVDIRFTYDDRPI